MNDVTKRWEEFLNPDLLKGKLITASIYIAVFEILKGSIIDHIKSFLAHEFTPDGVDESNEYREQVLSRNKSPLYASLSWLKENGVVDDQDLAVFERIRKARNSVAHEICGVIDGSAGLDYLELLPSMVSLLRKIEVWWIVNVEIPANPDFDGADVDESLIQPGPVMGIQLLVDIAIGDSERAQFYLRHLQQPQRQRAQS